MSEITVKWSTGPNIVGHYTGQKRVTLSDDESVDNAIDRALESARRGLHWHAPLKMVSTEFHR